jgi:hypothetical protein
VITLWDSSSFQRFNSSTSFGIGSSFFSCGAVFMKIPESGLTLVSQFGFPESRVSQSLRMVDAFLIFFVEV